MTIAMSDKTRIAVILGTIGLAGAAGLGYFVKVYLPAQKATAAQAEITAWEERLTAARTCLLGPNPASGKSSEALAVRELSPDPWERGTCTKLIGKLSRGMADDTGLLPVEHAWMAIDRSASRVATAFATHVDPMGETGDKRGKPSPLPEALEALDDAHAALRQAAGMSPPGAGIPALPAAQELPIGEGKDRVIQLDGSLPSAGGLIVFGDLADGRQMQLTLVPGAAPRAQAVQGAVLRAVPDGSWGAQGRSGAIAIGPIDTAGAPASPLELPTEGVAEPLIAVGTPASGLVAFAHLGGRLSIARASGGAFVAEAPIVVSGGVTAQDPDGRGLLAWSVDGAIHGLIVRDGGPTTPVPLGSGEPEPRGCFTSTAAWFSTGDQFIAFDGTTGAPHVLPEHHLEGCTREAALLSTSSLHYAVCGEGCRPVDVGGVRWSSAATVVDGKVVAVSERDHVLRVWREGAPPTYFSTTSRLHPRYMTTDGKVIDVIATTDDGVVIARIPAR